MCPCFPHCGSSSSSPKRKLPPRHQIIYPADLNLEHPSLPHLLLSVTHSLETYEAGLGSVLHAFLTAFGIRMPEYHVGSAREGKGKANVNGNLVIELRLRWDTRVSFTPVLGRGEGDVNVVWVVAVGARGDVRELLLPWGQSGDGEGRRGGIGNEEAGSEQRVKRKREGDDGGDWENGKRKRQERGGEDEDEEENSDAEWGVYLCDESGKEEGGNGDEDKKEDGNGKGRHRDSGVGIRINM